MQIHDHRFTPRDFIVTYGHIIIGCLIGGIAYPMFIIPHSIAPGGLTGVSSILYFLFKFPVGTTSLVMNIPLFILSWKEMGHLFAFRSLIATVLFSLCIDYVPVPVVTEDPLLAAVFGGLTIGIGLGMILRGGATTGGTDMIARLVHHKAEFMSIGATLFAIDCMVIVAAGFTMSINTALYSVICIFVQSKAIDLVMTGLGNAKACYVITDHPDEISDHVLVDLNRGATRIEAIGEYSKQKKIMLLCVISSKEIVHFKRIVKNEDPTAFLFITDTHETIGEGFKPISDN